MDFLNKISNINNIINTISLQLLRDDIDDNNFEPIDKIYNNTIFFNVELPGIAVHYKQIKNIDIWLINNISEQIYIETIDDYLSFNTSDHGKLVYESFLKHKTYYVNDYFGPEKCIITNKQGLLFVMTYTNEKGLICKKCHFKELVT